MFEVFVETANQFVKVLRTWSAEYALDKQRKLEQRGFIVFVEYKD
jgi:hypothetical protein